VPDNPHPHPPEFNQEVQQLLIILAHIVHQRMTPITSQSARSSTNENATAFNYIIIPDP